MLKKIRGSAIVNSSIHRTAKIESGSHVVNSSLNKYSFCGYDCTIINCDIGAFCSIANNVSIGGARHPLEWVSTSPVFYEGRDSVKKKFSEHRRRKPLKTIIKNDVWIGEKAIIKEGVTISDGAVIGMGSVVTKDVGPYCIAAGSPARIIRRRFDEEMVNEMVRLEWWNFDDNKLKKYAQYITDPRRFLDELKK